MLFSIVFLSLLFRHILATLHFNENVNRSTKTTRDGKNYVSVTYPKFKFGQEVVRNIPVPPTYGMLDVKISILLTHKAPNFVFFTLTVTLDNFTCKGITLGIILVIWANYKFKKILEFFQV
jgi:hypothetical protein